MKLDFHCLKNCDTCRKAQRALQAAGHEVNVVDIRRDGVPEAVLRDALARLGRERLLATRSPTWRKLDETARQRDLVELMLEYPVLMKRPLIIGRDSDHISAGWSRDVQAVLLDQAAPLQQGLNAREPAAKGDI